MRALIQIVKQASVTVDRRVVGEIDEGMLIFLGVGAEDTRAQADRLWEKISKLRIFKDAQGKTNLSLGQIGGSVMVVSQFTLFADARKGNRPSFTRAADAQQGEALYDYFLSLVERDVPGTAHGEFGADMAVSLINDGPFTIWLDTDDLKRGDR